MNPVEKSLKKYSYEDLVKEHYDLDKLEEENKIKPIIKGEELIKRFYCPLWYKQLKKQEKNEVQLH